MSKAYTSAAASKAITSGKPKDDRMYCTVSTGTPKDNRRYELGYETMTRKQKMLPELSQREFIWKP
jgi:hypothetical protein